MTSFTPRRGSYGIDAPFGPAFMAAMILLLLVNATIAGRWQLFVPIVIPITFLSLYLHFTLRGKFVAWAGLLDELQLRGDERILDMGCGRGAVLLMAAQRLTTGRAVGVDLWRKVDQSGNALDATRRNAVAEGVDDRVDLHTGDMTALPFEDNNFDVIVSSLAIHNIPSRAGRAKAIAEAMRVLRPGGRMIICDIKGTGPYEPQLLASGMTDVSRRFVGWRYLILRAVRARKPGGAGRT
jgi:ubiquinone/menaquinone biosynthesis C-methylase UbiE